MLWFAPPAEAVSGYPVFGQVFRNHAEMAAAGEFAFAGSPGSFNQEQPMTKSYAQIVKQIKALEAEAEKARRTEIDGVITRIREAVQFYNLSAADLGLTGKAKPEGAKAAPFKRKRRKAAAPKTQAAAKFTDGQGNSWVGRGKRPQWLRDALAAGKQLSDFAVK